MKYHSKSEQKRVECLKAAEIKKPREYWIEFGGDPSNDKEVYKRYSATVPFKPCSLSDEVIHVIEKSAYDKLKESENKKIMELMTAIGTLVDNETELKIKLRIAHDSQLRTYDGLADKADKYDAAIGQCEQLVSALDRIITAGMPGTIAEEALADYEAWRVKQ